MFMANKSVFKLANNNIPKITYPILFQITTLNITQMARLELIITDQNQYIQTLSKINGI